MSSIFIVTPLQKEYDGLCNSFSTFGLHSHIEQIGRLDIYCFHEVHGEVPYLQIRGATDTADHEAPGRIRHQFEDRYEEHRVSAGQMVEDSSVKPVE